MRVPGGVTEGGERRGSQGVGRRGGGARGESGRLGDYGLAGTLRWVRMCESSWTFSKDGFEVQCS